MKVEEEKEESVKVRKKIKEILEKKGLFFYEEDWYRKLREEVIGSISEKEFEQIADEVVVTFLKERKKQ